MSGIVNLWERLTVAAPKSPARVAQEIDEELAFHVHSAADENMARGMSRDDAWAEAQRRFGSVDQYAKQIWRIDMGNYLTIQRLALGGILLLGFLCGWLWLQVEELHGQNTQIMQLVQNKTGAEKTEAMKSYPIKYSPEEVREFSKLSIDFGKLQLHADAASLVPIDSQAGITGLVVLGDGTFKYQPEADKTFEGRFRSVLLRFNPKDLDAIVKLGAGKRVTDKSSYETGRQIIQSTFRHCYHSNMEALIPAEGAIAADINSREYGDILISQDAHIAVVHNFTDNQSLYEKK